MKVLCTVHGGASPKKAVVDSETETHFDRCSVWRSVCGVSSAGVRCAPQRADLVGTLKELRATELSASRRNRTTDHQGLVEQCFHNYWIDQLSVVPFDGHSSEEVVASSLAAKTLARRVTCSGRGENGRDPRAAARAQDAEIRAHFPAESAPLLFGAAPA